MSAICPCHRAINEPKGSSYEVHIRDDEMRGLEVRVAYTWIRLDAEGKNPALVQVAETREKRSVLAAEIIKGVMLPQFALLPLGRAFGVAGTGARHQTACRNWRSASAPANPTI